MKKGSIFLALVTFCSFSYLVAQNKPRFENDIQTIRQYDKIYAPSKNPILFVGSSSIRLWSDLERDFADYGVINRGIGGSVINEITYYVNELIVPYHPRQIVLYVGENDLPDENTTGDSILNRTIHLLTLIREKLPNVPIVYISIKPSPSREKYLAKMILANRLIHDYLATQNEMEFVDVCSLMLTPDGKPKPELFREDRLHMNKMGYSIWIKKIKPYLKKNKEI
jgi:lysophospholipase L1-like esterase